MKDDHQSLISKPLERMNGEVLPSTVKPGDMEGAVHTVDAIRREIFKKYAASVCVPASDEQDPHGKDAHTAGAKLDAGKNRLGLVLLAFSRALQEVGKVGTYGAAKYSDNGWIEVPDGEARYTDALLRHLFKFAEGEEFDADTGLSHMAHMCWNGLAVLDLMLRRAKQQGG